MAARRSSPRDIDQLDLLSWAPPPIVERYEDERVRAFDLSHQIARAVSETLSACALSREEIAAQMSETPSAGNVSKPMLDNYAAPAKTHEISVVRWIALMRTTGDTRMLQMIAEMFGKIVVDAKHELAVKALLLREQKEAIETEERAVLQAWRRNIR